MPQIIKKFFVKTIVLLIIKRILCSFALVQNNEFRYAHCLDGLWNFVREPVNSYGIGFSNDWASLDLAGFANYTVMPVPAAFNNITPDQELRDHVGWFVNGVSLSKHIGGHLPFEAEIPQKILSNSNGVLKISLAVNNTLSLDTIPTADFEVETFPSGRSIVKQTLRFDFFNYAGILRPVHICYLPSVYIMGVKIFADSEGNFKYEVHISSTELHDENYIVKVMVIDSQTSEIVYEGIGLHNTTKINNPKLWWPRSLGNPNLYLAEISLLRRVSEVDGNSNNVEAEEQRIDIYRETFGFRSVSIMNKSSILVNGRPFYCQGVGMHEDFHVYGRGFSRTVMIRDLNLLEWLGGNCFRTSHYPYSEERIYEADRRGIVVIEETPAVAISNFASSKMKKLHAKMLKELITRDRNHPSIIAWSLSNEAKSEKSEARDYYRDLVILAKSLDPSRLVTAVYSTQHDKDTTADLVDFICLNRYYGWYHELGYLQAINESLTTEILQWRERFLKPMLLTEYGAEAINGFSGLPSIPFGTNYQVELLEKTHNVLDFLRKSGNLAGEMIWNFADFMTQPTLTRAIGNHKGVFTRSRNPKPSAFVLKNRYIRNL